METIVNNDQRYISVAAGELLIPIAMTAHELVDYLKEHIVRDQHELILREQGLTELPGGLSDDDVLYPAMSFVQLEWFRATREGVVPPVILANHQERLGKLRLRIKEVLSAPPPPPKPPRPPRGSKEPKAPRAPKVPRAEPTYEVNRAIADQVKLGAQADLVRQALVASEGTVTVTSITTAVEAMGKLVTRQPVHRVVKYYFIQFLDLGLIQEVK
jgi:hypothetical protein